MLLPAIAPRLRRPSKAAVSASMPLSCRRRRVWLSSLTRSLMISSAARRPGSFLPRSSSRSATLMLPPRGLAETELQLSLSSSDTS
ncbi:hypothetical protein D3C78_1700470 [compost metagenome]